MKRSKTIFNTLITLWLCIALAACSKDDDNPPTEKQTYLSKTITSSSTTTYQYDQNNRTISSAVEFSSSPLSIIPQPIHYNSSGQLTEWLIDYTNSTDNTKLVYSYNGDGKISGKNVCSFGSIHYIEPQRQAMQLRENQRDDIK